MKKNNPQISVIIPCYNQEKYIAECLDSILMQTFTDYEVIIIDDGSTDNSIQIINKYKEKFTQLNIIQQRNQGVVNARNIGISCAKGIYILPLDADDIIDKNLLLYFYNDIVTKKGDIITSRVLLFGKDNGEISFPTPNKYHLSNHNCLVNAALFKKSDFEKIKGYDDAFNLGLEDWDLWLNMIFNLNLKIYRHPEILFFYRIKDTSESRNLQQFKYSKQLKQQLLNKYPKMKFYQILYKICKFIFFYKIKKEKIYVRLLGLPIFTKRLNKS